MKITRQPKASVPSRLHIQVRLATLLAAGALTVGAGFLLPHCSEAVPSLDPNEGGPIYDDLPSSKATDASEAGTTSTGGQDASSANASDDNAQDGGAEDAATRGDDANDDGGPQDGNDGTRVFPKVIINEIAADGEPEDWFELYNPNDTAVDLGGYTFTDDAEDPGKAVFAAGTTITPGGYFVRTLNDTDPGFKLGAKDQLLIFDPALRPVDAVAWQKGDSPKSAAFGRHPDAQGAFVTLKVPTPGGPNSDLVCVRTEDTPEGESPCETNEPAQIVINEVTSEGDDEIELFNTGDQDADLTGWAVADDDYNAEDPKTDDHRFIFPAGVDLAGRAYLVLRKGEQHTFGLGATDSVRLYDAAGTIVDEVHWTDGEAVPSYARQPNGTGTFSTSSAATFGSSN